jgi:hypothetical protein
MLTKLWIVIVAIFLEVAGSAQAPTQLAAFPTTVGSYSGNTPAYRDHPDFTCSPSSSVDAVLCVSGQSVDVYTRAGRLVSSTPTREWMATRLPGVKASVIADPRMIFDPFIDPEGSGGRFVFACSCGYITGTPRAYAIVGISDTADPSGKWHAAQLGTSESGDLTLVPGFDKNGLYIVYAQPSTGWSYSAIAIWKNSALGKKIPAPLQTFDNTNGSPTYQVFPALDYNPNKPQTSPMYFISACDPPNNAANCQNNSRKLTVTLNILTWNSSGTAVALSKSNVPTDHTYNGRPGPAIQPGGARIKANESHFSGMSVQGSNGHLYTSAASSMKAAGGEGAAGTNGFFAYEIDPEKLSVVREFQVGGNTSSQPFEALFPAVTSDANNNVVWTYSQVSPTQYVTPAVVYLPANGNALSGAYVLNPEAAVASYRGACPRIDPPGMMGNYSCIVRDLSNANDLWVFGVYGAYDNACKWATEAVRFTLTATKKPQPAKP